MLWLFVQPVNAAEVPSRSGENGAICVARERRAYGSGIRFTMRVDRALVGEVRNGRYLCTQVEPGSWRVSMSGDLGDALKATSYATNTVSTAMQDQKGWAASTGRRFDVSPDEVIYLEASLHADPGMVTSDNQIVLERRDARWFAEIDAKPAKDEQVSRSFDEVFSLPDEVPQAAKEAVLEKAAAERVEEEWDFDDEEEFEFDVELELDE